MNVVRSLELSLSFRCQKPLFASSLEMTFVPASFPRVCSVVGMGWFSRNTALFNWIKSPHMRTFPLGFGTTTVGEHHAVGASTFSITPIVSIRSSSSLTFGSSGIVTRLGVVWLNGSCEGVILISYSPSMQPRPLETFGKRALISSADCVTVPTLATVSSAKQADLPSSRVSRFSTT